LAYPELRWPFKEWGADIVIHGHIHAYERIQKGGMIYLTNGAGGRSLVALGNTPGSVVRYSGDYGAIRGVATQKRLTLQFRNTDDIVIDTVEITSTKRY
jgi:predicted phosphodiesterase